jgi:serine/threonine-protein kinase
MICQHPYIFLAGQGRREMRDRILKGRQGQYKLIDTIGSGTMATVFIGRDVLSNRIFAVKVLKPDVAVQEDLLKRFKREAEILTTLANPHVVRLIEYALDDTIYFLVMEYVDGATLKQCIVAGGAFPTERALDFTEQIAKALHVAFQQQVIHRDVKPQNILVTAGNLAKLTDFGLARSQNSAPLTERGTFMGTAYYASPEQVRDSHNVDTRADLYALTCVFFEMLTGRVPYEGKNVLDVLGMHINGPLPSLLALRPDIPPAFEEFIHKGMAKNPAARFQTPQEYIQELEALKMHLDAPPLRAQVTILANGVVVYLTKVHSTIGRLDSQFSPPEVDLTNLDNTRRVSRRHARILQEGGHFFVEDLKALNPTRLNGVPLPPFEKHELHDGDTLHVGDLDLRFSLVQS